ncbi:MAG: biotin--[acetyl-CoA-carboxylase] ligase [Gemmatimonadota bacterium]
MNGASGPAAGEWWGRAPEAWRDRWSVPELHLFRSIGSTNDFAAERADAGAPAGTLVLAEHQSAGRGRRGRTWLAPPGSALLLSMVYRLAAAKEGLPGAAPLHVGLAVAEALEAVGARCTIKWPNDVLLDGAKVAGVLCEASMGPNGGHVIAGVGVNVRQQPGDWPPELRQQATSLEAALGRPFDLAAVATPLVARLLALRNVVSRTLDDDTLGRIAARDALRGHAISIDGRDVGRADGITTEGALRVVRHDGSVGLVHAGTVRVATEP